MSELLICFLYLHVSRNILMIAGCESIFTLCTILSLFHETEKQFVKPFAIPQIPLNFSVQGSLYQKHSKCHMNTVLLPLTQITRLRKYFFSDYSMYLTTLSLLFNNMQFLKTWTIQKPHLVYYSVLLYLFPFNQRE